MTCEYILIAQVNDSDEQARQLAKQARALKAIANFSPYTKDEGLDWTQEVDALLEEEEEEEKLTPADSFEDHSLYRAAFALTVWIDHMFDQDATLQNEPSAVKLATHAALASAKLAAALSGEDVDEIGMTIAYLKRALKAITLSMDAAAALLREKRIAAPQHAVLLQRLFQVRDGIITLIGEYRCEWRRRFGSEGFRG